MNLGTYAASASFIYEPFFQQGDKMQVRIPKLNNVNHIIPRKKI